MKEDDVVTDTGMIRVSEEMSELLNRKKDLKEECEQYTRYSLSLIGPIRYSVSVVV